MILLESFEYGYFIKKNKSKKIFKSVSLSMTLILGKLLIPVKFYSDRIMLTLHFYAEGPVVLIN